MGQECVAHGLAAVRPDRARDLERMRPALQPGDILAIDTGCAARVGTPTTTGTLHCSVAGANGWYTQKVKLVAVDMRQPDVAPRPASGVHLPSRVLLARPAC